MNTYHFRSIVVVISLVFISGCVGYVSPYPQPYAVPSPVIMPYYNYGVYPVVPVIRFGGRGWRHGGYRHYRHH